MAFRTWAEPLLAMSERAIEVAAQPGSPLRFVPIECSSNWLTWSQGLLPLSRKFGRLTAGTAVISTITSRASTSSRASGMQFFPSRGHSHLGSGALNGAAEKAPWLGIANTGRAANSRSPWPHSAAAISNGSSGETPIQAGSIQIRFLPPTRTSWLPQYRFDRGVAQPLWIALACLGSLDDRVRD